MGRKLVVVLLAGLLLGLLLTAPRAYAGSGTEYLNYTIESEIQENKIMPPADSGVPPSAPSAPAAPVTVSSFVPPPVIHVLTINKPTPDFTISITPASRTITRGESTTYTVTVASVDGFLGYVALSVSGLPSGAGYSLPSRVSVPANGSAVATLTVTTTTSTPAGASTLTLTGTGNGTKSASAGLTIQAPTPPPPPMPSLPSIRPYNFDDRRSDIPLNTPLGQQVQANWGNWTAMGAAVAAQTKSDLITSVTKVEQGLNSLVHVAKQAVNTVVNVIQQMVNVIKNLLSGIFR